MTRIIGVISGKGGVGKTVTVANLGVSLAKQGKSVIILDANVTTPSLSLHLGIPFYPTTLHDVLRKNAHIYDAVYYHPSGVKVIPASLSVDEVRNIDVDKLQSVLLNLLGTADIIILDAAAGLGKEALAAIDVADELLIVTNPELPAVTDALKTIKMAEDYGTKILGVVVNRVKGYNYELENHEIESILDNPILATIPEDIAVPRAIAAKEPVVTHKPRSKSARQFKKLAAIVSGEGWYETKKEKSWFDRLFSWLS